MSDARTGGQYSIYRALLGSYLLVHFLMLLPYATELFAAGGTVAHASLSPLFGTVPNPLMLGDGQRAVIALVAVGALCSAMLAAGWRDRVAAVSTALILGWLYQRNPLIANPSLPLVGWLLVLHAFVPPRPYGSLAGRIAGTDPSWRMPGHLFVAVWVVLALSYSHSGWTKLASPSWVDGDTIRLVLENPLARDHVFRDWMLATPPALLESMTWLLMFVELLFAPLAMIRRVRPWIWLAMLFAQLGFLVFLDFADLTFPMLLVHLLTFDPAWLARHARRDGATVLFDGDCAFCHASVRLALHEDAARRLRFAPLGGATHRAMSEVDPDAGRRESIVVITADGEVATRSRAVVAILERLGGLWWMLSRLLAAVPVGIADRGYDMVGRWRYRLGGRVPLACPVAIDGLGRLLP